MKQKSAQFSFVRAQYQAQTKANKMYEHVECIRERTFTNFPFPEKNCALRDLLKCLPARGFYYSGEEDCVNCYYCEVMLNNFTKFDLIDERHRQSSPMCPVAHGDFTTNIPSSLVPSMNPAHWKYLDETRRLITFNKRSKFSAEKLSLSDAGFFYDAKRGVVCCHHCSLSLHPMEVENKYIWSVHRDREPTCGFFIAMTPRFAPNTHIDERLSLMKKWGIIK